MINILCVAGPRVDISVGAQPFVHLAAEQLIHRLIGFLANDVPTGHFKRRQNAHEREVGVLGKTAGIDPAPHIFDIVRIIAGDVAREHILYHFGNQMRFERDAICLADTRHAAIGCQFHEHEIAAAKMRWRITNDEGFDIG